ncbi:phosphonate ABC transporter, permease protein PhnE [Paenibacillus sp.]|uniref:phosphonate ABC transporter, permease protein PhnE n=1 Tax=Paenibacillus sp. TaxID=58172 RepID=UPI002D601A18|nr:phosphonate ABC transporter, permease protein PhnE [Paenibacillus sp.]HZG85075.1 phosphonate ABC transporter, permease protein PhnE [Paenibacillus sp.]
MLWLTRSIIIIALLILGVVAVSWSDLGLDPARLLSAENIVSFIRNDWLPPDWSVLPEAVRESLVTVEIAFLSTFFALVFAVPLSFLAAGNVVSGWLRGVVRLFLSFLRSVPEIVFGLLFVVAVGLGPFPAVIAIFLHNVGVLGKLVSELVEAADPAPQEALRAAGASRGVVALYAVLPQIAPNIVSQYFYRFEVAIRTSLILGIIGAGGIGQQLFMHFKVFKYAQVTVDVLVVMALVVGADAFSAWVRKRMI